MSSDDDSRSRPVDYHATCDTSAVTVSISAELPPDMPGTGYSFAPHAASGRDTLITASAALAAAQATGIMADAWSQGTPTAALVRYTNTLNRTSVDVPVWVIITVGASQFSGGPHGHHVPPHPYTRLAEWIIDATTGTYISAASRGI